MTSPRYRIEIETEPIVDARNLTPGDTLVRDNLTQFATLQRRRAVRPSAWWVYGGGELADHVIEHAWRRLIPATTWAEGADAYAVQHADTPAGLSFTEETADA